MITVIIIILNLPDRYLTCRSQPIYFYMKILITEDHPELGSIIKEELGKAGFIADWVMNGRDAISLLKLNQYDAVILDLGLPDMDGNTVLKQAIRVDTPCLILTARDALDSKLEHLNKGADDYILKPFDMSELEARIRVVLRRPRQRSSDVLIFSDLSFNRRNQELVSAKDSIILAKREAALVELLMNSAPRTIVKDYLEDSLYGLDEEVSPNAVEALVSRTRRKLTKLNTHCQIETIRGVGYRITERK